MEMPIVLLVISFSSLFPKPFVVEAVSLVTKRKKALDGEGWVLSLLFMSNCTVGRTVVVPGATADTAAKEARRSDLF